jgi:hypothetical protein
VVSQKEMNISRWLLISRSSILRGSLTYLVKVRTNALSDQIANENPTLRAHLSVSLFLLLFFLVFSSPTSSSPARATALPD